MKPILIAILVLFSAILQAQNTTPNAHDQSSTTEDEHALKAVVEKFLTAAGNHDVAIMRTLFLPKANIGGYSFRDGKWTSYVITVEEWFDRISKSSSAKPYTEPVSNYTIDISEGRLAFVKADAVLHSDSQPRSHNMDFFVLMKENDQWRFLSGSYTSMPIY
jgi:hypothetical protein